MEEGAAAVLLQIIVELFWGFRAGTERLLVPQEINLRHDLCLNLGLAAGNASFSKVMSFVRF